MAEKENYENRKLLADTVRRKKGTRIHSNWRNASTCFRIAIIFFDWNLRKVFIWFVFLYFVFFYLALEYLTFKKNLVIIFKLRNFAWRILSYFQKKTRRKGKTSLISWKFSFIYYCLYFLLELSTWIVGSWVVGSVFC